MIPTPVQLLQSKLNELERSLEKSNVGYMSKNITLDTHLQHKCNLLPKIGEYKLAIFKLIEINKKNIN